jgi:RNA polymerase sigma-70 factor (ECF subfamily)
MCFGNPFPQIGQALVMMPPGETDRGAMRAAQHDPHAFGAVFERHFDDVRRYLVRRVGPALGDDLAAETFVLALDGRRRFDASQGEVRPWLFGIAANLLRRHRREENRRLAAYARTGVDPVLDELGLAEERLDARRQGPALAGALGALPAREREPLLLLAWAGLSYEEIAIALGEPLGTVRSRLSRGRARVRRALTEAEEPVPDARRASLVTDGKGRLT